jgi:DNA ligase D
MNTAACCGAAARIRHENRNCSVRPHHPSGRRYGAAVTGKANDKADEAGDGPVTLELAGREFEVTSPGKVFFPERGDTKLDLVEYYASVEEPLMRAMGDRPVLLQRFPEGAGGSSFFQKRVPAKRPTWISTTTVSTPNGTESEALVIADIAHVAYAVNMGCLGFHVWPSRASDLEHADELRIDLDPTPGVTYDQIREGAAVVKGLLDELGLVGHPKTSGNKGLHIYLRLAPRWDSYEVRAAAVALARELERRRPDLLTAAWWKEERGQRVFIDYNQNAPHKTIFGAWSVRARPGAQVSTPITWDEVARLHPDELTIASVPDLLAERGDPWAEMEDNPQSIEPLLAMSARDMETGLMDAPWPPVYPKQPNEPPRVAPSRAKKDKD